MPVYDDDLTKFASDGAPLLPQTMAHAYVKHDGAHIWYATAGAGLPVVLLHGGLGHSGNWGYQLPKLVESGYRVIVIDSRGHGRSTRDERPYSYELMTADVKTVMDALNVEKAAFVGWSDGSCIALILAAQHPERVEGVFFFACNIDPSGTKPFEFTEIIGRCFNRHKQDYAELSATPDQFDEFSAAIDQMQATQPNYSSAELAQINVPVTIVHAEHDEFIKRDHADYLARTLPDAKLVLLQAVSHFAPLQRPAYFNTSLVDFLRDVNHD